MTSLQEEIYNGSRLALRLAGMTVFKVGANPLPHLTQSQASPYSFFDTGGIMKSIWKLLLAIGFLLQVVAGAAFADEHNKINLRLMSKKSVIGSDGCALAFWQRNRDPNKDKFAYVFYLNFHDAHPTPPIIKIGKKRYELDRVDFGSINVTDAYQVFRSADKKITVLLEILKTQQDNDYFVVEKAQLTFVMIGKLPFRMNVIGRMGCDDTEPVAKAAPVRASKPSNLDPNAVRLGREVTYSAFSQVPRHIVQLVRNNGEACDIDNGPEYASSFAISGAMTLWQLPCALYASNATSVLITALNGTKFANMLEVPEIPGNNSGEPNYALMNMVIKPKNAVVTTSNINTAGNCGTFERYQLIVTEGEAIEIKLLEARAKESCNGPVIAPENLPLLYQAN